MKFELNTSGVADLMKSAEMKAVLAREAEKVKNRAGDGYGYEVKTGQKRAYANIYPDTPEAVNDNYENNTLLKALK